MIDLDLKSKYNDENLIICNIKFQVRQGERVIITGPSGCGKSVLMSILRGSDFEGKLIFDKNERIRYIPQNIAINMDDQVFRSVFFAGIRNGLSWRKSKADAHHWLTQFGMDSKEDYKKTISKLSGGEVRRVMLAQKLIGENSYDVILADEIDASLDSHTATLLFKNLAESCEHYNHTLIAICHNSDTKLWTDYFTRCILLGKDKDNGYTLAYDGSPEGAFKTFGVSSCRQLLGLLKLSPEQRKTLSDRFNYRQLNDNLR